jgi:hypothetical protein
MDALPEDVDEHRNGEHRSSAAEHPEAQTDAEAEGYGRQRHGSYSVAARQSGCSVGQPCARQVPTPPSATWMTSDAPARCSSDAATALR